MLTCESPDDEASSDDRRGEVVCCPSEMLVDLAPKYVWLIEVVAETGYFQCFLYKSHVGDRLTCPSWKRSRRKHKNFER